MCVSSSDLFFNLQTEPKHYVYVLNKFKRLYLNIASHRFYITCILYSFAIFFKKFIILFVAKRHASTTKSSNYVFHTFVEGNELSNDFESIGNLSSPPRLSISSTFFFLFRKMQLSHRQLCNWHEPSC